MEKLWCLIKLPKDYVDYEGPEGLFFEIEALIPDFGFLKEFVYWKDGIIFPKPNASEL